MREALLTFFQQKCWRISDVNALNLNETLTNNVLVLNNRAQNVKIIGVLNCFILPKKMDV